MANETGESTRNQEQGSESLTSIPALRHVGKTLESDPGYLERTDADDVSGGISTPEDQIAREGASPETHVNRGSTDLAANLTGNDGTWAQSVRSADQPEDLKTRLPGDTSSDPHADLGPDNATTVQHRGE